ncbi:MAG: SbcC/MukB-like Walker B domain-containing protein [Clostridium sp.]
MKKLKRMLLIHWHNYVKEVIEFDTINFLTGKTAAGKSTIIDALQLVLLGDTSGTFFNKAANQKSSRTLKSYLFGEKGDDGDTGFRYIRNERFSGYVVLEFEDTERKKLFTTGIVCDCYKDQSFDYKWFVIHSHGMPDNLFIDEKSGIPYDSKELKAFLANWLGARKNVEFEFFDTNKRYQEVMLGKFGQIKDKYRTLLRKAVPFSPIADIEQFITESICDIKNQINIDQMQSDIRQYKNLEEDAGRTQEKIGYLKGISSLNREYEGEKDKYLQQKYVWVRAGKEEKIQKEAECRRTIQESENQIACQMGEMEKLGEELAVLEKRKERLTEEYHTSDMVKRERVLKEQLEKLSSDIAQLEAGIQDVIKKTHEYGHSWTEKLRDLRRVGFKADAPVEAESLIESLCTLDAEQAENFSFVEAAEQFERLKSEVDEFQAGLKARAEQLKQTISELETVVSDLKKGIKPYPYEVTTLKRVLEEELFRIHHKAVPVSILADLLEIPNPRWRNAIEGYLDKQKFYLLVPEAYYRDSLHIYNQEKQEKNISEVGLIDIGKLRKNVRRTAVQGSLTEEIETEHSDAGLYAEYLLGGVMKCDHVDELRNHKMAVTDEGMLYKGYVTRQIKPSRYANPFIGRKSMELLLQQKTEELERQKVLYEQVGSSHRIAKTASMTRTMSLYEAEQHKQAMINGKEIAVLKEKSKEVTQEYDSLDFLYLDRMKKQIDDCMEVMNTKDDLRHDLDKKNVKLTTILENLRNEKLPELTAELARIEKEIEEQFDRTWITQIGEVRFEQERASNRTMEALRTGFFAAMRQSEVKKDRLRKERTERRSRYNGQYKMPYDIELESNQYFDRELDTLEDIRLPEYIEKIKDSKEKAYRQFQDDFIAKIKSNIEMVTEQINELNASLKQSVFGTDTYRFEKKPRPEYRQYYEMIMDPLLMDTGGWNIASQSFNEKYQKEIGELFQLLILNETNVSAERRAEYEKSIKKFTDYRTYLFFDLVVTNEQGEEQRLSKTLLKKSGGETQIPFYIALLASFSQVCRIRNKNQNNTIRIIILDEAFSKMDGERIRESIHLLRRFKLQAIFSAPPDKIPDIAPLVDRNIAVYKDNQHSFTRSFDPQEIDEELLED